MEIPEGLEVGKIYKVDLEDCCLAFKFTSKLIKISIEDEELFFENGVVITRAYDHTGLFNLVENE